MKKVLYITNTPVPYRIRFFNEFAKYCELTVLYEREFSKNRNDSWTKSIEKNYNIEYLNGFNINNEYSFSLKILKYLNKSWDRIIISCYNSPVQIFAIMILRTKGIPYIISLDGETFIHNSFKDKIKKIVLKDALKYMTAGEESAKSLSRIIGRKESIFPYYFSSMTTKDLNRSIPIIKRDNYVLVIGQYYPYKGLDIAYKVACKDKSIKYKFVGMGNRTNIFIKDVKYIPENIEIIPFLQKDELEKEYMKCALLLLPTRQECWGLVVNEAASFGTPIVSTWGSGSAIELIKDSYPQYLAEVNNVESLLSCIKRCLYANDNNSYGMFLKNKNQAYNIEHMVKEHVKKLL